MKTLSLLAFFGLCLTSFMQSQPIHDECTNAIPLTNLIPWQSVLVDLSTATESLDLSCENPSDLNRDVWYIFTMPFDGKLRVNSVTSSSHLALFDACGGTELSCISGSSYFDSLSNGSTYYLRYGSPLAGFTTDNISVQAFGEIPNENCSSAAIVPNIDNPQSITVDLRSAYEELDASCEVASNDNFDAWYEFVMPFDGKIEISGLSSVNYASLFDQCGGTEIGCRFSSGFFDNLLANTTYYLRYSTASNFAHINTFVIQAFPPPINDECSAATLIPFVDTLQSVAVDTRGASESLDASCENASSDNFDVWYTFTMPFDGKIKLSGLSVIQKIALYDQCGGTEIDCLSGNGFMDGLMAGNTYLLKYGTASVYAGNNVFSIQAFGIPPNDVCANALNIPNIASEQLFIADPRGASQSLLASCENGLYEHFDLWYSFTMPFDGKIEVSGVFGVNRIALYDSCGGTELACQLSGGFFYGLSGGSTYQLRYSSLPQQAVSDNVALQAFPAPINDECEDALLLTNIASPQDIFLDTREATESLNISCEDAANDNLDLWYAFTMPVDGKFEVSGVFGVNKIALFDSCGGTELDCFASSGFFNGLTAGSTYILRYAAISAQANADQITVQALPVVSNDECVNAFLLTGIDSPQTVSLDTRPATESLDASCEIAANENLDLWYTFEMPFTGKLVLSGLSTNRRIVLYDSCGGNELHCIAGNDTLYGLPGNTPYILRYATLSQSAAADDFTIQAFPPPPHDVCDSARVIDSLDTGRMIYVDTREGTESLDASCETVSDTHLDFWYRFTMPFDGKIEVTALNGAHTVSLWDSCSGTELGCFAGSGVFETLKVDSTYFLRFAAPIAQASPDSFHIQAIIVSGNELPFSSASPGLKAFPNPASEVLQVEWNQAFQQPIHLSILDGHGRLIRDELLPQVVSQQTHYTIPIKPYSPGLYFLRLQIGSQQIIHPFIKH